MLNLHFISFRLAASLVRFAKQISLTLRCTADAVSAAYPLRMQFGNGGQIYSASFSSSQPLKKKSDFALSWGKVK